VSAESSRGSAANGAEKGVLFREGRSAPQHNSQKEGRLRGSTLLTVVKVSRKGGKGHGELALVRRIDEGSPGKEARKGAAPK